MAENDDEDHPRLTAELFAQAEAESTLYRAWASGRLPHAWMLTGPKGVGKATLAYRFARFLLHSGESQGQNPNQTLDIPRTSRTWKWVARGGHPDLMVLERRVDEKGKKSAFILAEDARKLIDFAHMTAANGGWRVVIVDALEDMNKTAANALLKILEEPPARMAFLLVCHHPGAVLPTLHSRCCHLSLRAMECDQLSEILVHVLRDCDRPIDLADARLLATLSEGSQGKALALWEVEGSDLYQKMTHMIAGLLSGDGVALHKFADDIISPRALGAFETVMELYLWWVGRVIALRASGGARDAEENLGTETMRSVGQRGTIGDWLALRDRVLSCTAQTVSLHLDRKQVILSLFADLKNVGLKNMSRS